jgi:hypothetical protein
MAKKATHSNKTSKGKAKPQAQAQAQEQAQSSLQAEEAAPQPDQTDVQHSLMAEPEAPQQDANTSTMGFVGQQSLGLDDLLGGLMGGSAAGGMQPQAGGLDLGAILGGMQPQAGGLDLGAILGGLLGGMGQGGMPGAMPGGAGTGMGMGGPLDGIIGPMADDLSSRLGVPREVIMMGAMFLASKLLSGGMQSQQGSATGDYSTQPSMPDMQQGGGIDLGAILGGLLGGGAAQGGASQSGGMPDLGSILGGMMSQAPAGDGPPQGGANLPPAPADEGEVLGRIGQPIGDAAPSSQPVGPSGSIHINGLTANTLHGSDMVSEFAQYAGVDEDTAERSLSALMQVMGGDQR